jgi:hypothetical protein
MWVASRLSLSPPAVREPSLVKKENGEAPKPVLKFWRKKILVLLGIKL